MHRRKKPYFVCLFYNKFWFAASIIVKRKRPSVALLELQRTGEEEGKDTILQSAAVRAPAENKDEEARGQASFK